MLALTLINMYPHVAFKLNSTLEKLFERMIISYYDENQYQI